MVHSFEATNLITHIICFKIIFKQNLFACMNTTASVLKFHYYYLLFIEMWHERDVKMRFLYNNTIFNNFAIGIDTQFNRHLSLICSFLFLHTETVTGTNVIKKSTWLWIFIGIFTHILQFSQRKHSFDTLIYLDTTKDYSYWINKASAAAHQYC